MKKINYLVVLCIFGYFQGVRPQAKPDRICAASKYDIQCQQLQRGASEVNCEYAQDAIECAQKIRNSTAEFGIFSSENILHLATLGWDGMVVIKELRHIDRIREQYDYQSAVVVKSSFKGGLDGLRGLNFCHPGLHYGKSQRWSERSLKHFERLVVPNSCDDGKSPAQIEAAGLSKYFNSTCRPGAWSNNPQENLELKAKYKNLCSHCDNPSTCSYETSSASNHKAALDCLTKKGGDVAYASLQDITEYFKFNSDKINDYAYLCPNGTIENIANNQFPCIWLSQPWKAIISSNSRAIDLAARIERWMRASGGSAWESAIREIITADSHSVQPVQSIQSPTDYLRPARQIPIPTDLCGTQSVWCTKSFEEHEKCEVVRTAALTSGIYPIVECREAATSTVSCLNDISGGRADFMGIDSNFGYLARHPYNLTTAMFQETEKEKYSSVVVLVHATSKFERFENLKNSKACLTEFGGIASIAFVNVGKSRGIFKKNNCNFGKMLGDFFGDSCAPGSRDELHDPSGKNPESLCALCRSSIRPVMRQVPVVHESSMKSDGDSLTVSFEGEESIDTTFDRNAYCVANENNRFYGTKGALTCLSEVGEVAILESQNLAQHAKDLKLDPNNYKIICRNGSLANYVGFDVDEDCLLTTIVDGEIVVRKDSDKTAGIVNLLSSLDIYLQVDPDFKMYNIFSSHRNLLFEDSALGLVSPNQTLGHAVQNYVRLFENVEDCVDGKSAAQTMTINILLTVLVSIFGIFRA